MDTGDRWLKTILVGMLVYARGHWPQYAPVIDALLMSFGFHTLSGVHEEVKKTNGNGS